MESEQKNEKKDNQDVLYVNINPDNPITEIESLCMNCQKNGMTRLLPTKIPYFKEVIIMAFSCPHCGYYSSEVESGGELPDQGIKFTLQVSSSKDMDRQVIKSNFATIKIPCCGLEIPPNTQKGKLSTIEGFILATRDQFKEALDTGFYSEMGEDFLTKIKALVTNLTDALEGKKFPFEFFLDDPSGKSFIQNPYAPQTDQGIKVEYYERTKEQLESMGYSTQNQIDEVKEMKKEHKEFIDPSYYDSKKNFTVYKSNSEISNKIIDFTKSISGKEESLGENLITFQVDCSACHSPGEMNSCVCTIPYFKEIIISCFKCEVCGFKTTEVKGGGGISEKGMKITLHVDSPEDLNRDLFKSESSKIVIPEIGFESSEGSLGSMFTTIEGIIDKIIENIENIPFMKGDSAEGNEKFELFIRKLKTLKEGKEKFTLILDDPLANSFIFSIGKPEDDKKITKEEYERTFEQNEDLGINDMKVD